MMRHLLARITLLLLLTLALSSCRDRAEGHWVAFISTPDGYRSTVLSSEPAIPSGSPIIEVDLDADGTPEAVYLEEGQVRIERERQTVWRGEPEWRVVDVAAGDVGDDLRQEVLVALWKEDASGTPRSHPFIIGHRRGHYDVLWGGSAVVDPIYDLDLGDVDGDGRSELVVLEGEYGEPVGTPARFVTVWRWNGWGFTLLWRSDPGRYLYLHLLDLDGDGAPEIVVQLL